jgi:hypothetical protein
MLKKLSREQEADLLLEYIKDSDQNRLSSALGLSEKLEKQFAVIQGRSQLLLTLGTITLTITGFSGPKIASSGPVAQWGMTLGLAFVLMAMICLIWGSLKIQWVTQWTGDDLKSTILGWLEYRDRKTRSYHLEVSLLALGLSAYVIGIIAYVGAFG